MTIEATPELLLKLYEQGVRFPQLMRAFGLSGEQVMEQLKQAGWHKTSLNGARYSPETKAAAVERVRNGENYAEVSRATGMPEFTIRAWSLRAGVKSRPQGLKDVTVEKVATMYQSGVSLSAIARQLGCSYGTAYRWLKKLGVPLRLRGKAGRPRCHYCRRVLGDEVGRKLHEKRKHPERLLAVPC